MYDIYIYVNIVHVGACEGGDTHNWDFWCLKKHKIKIIGTAILGSTYDLRNYICCNIFSV